MKNIKRHVFMSLAISTLTIAACAAWDPGYDPATPRWYPPYEPEPRSQFQRPRPKNENPYFEPGDTVYEKAVKFAVVYVYGWEYGAEGAKGYWDYMEKWSKVGAKGILACDVENLKLYEAHPEWIEQYQIMKDSLIVIALNWLAAHKNDQ